MRSRAHLARPGGSRRVAARQTVRNAPLGRGKKRERKAQLNAKSVTPESMLPRDKRAKTAQLAGTNMRLPRTSAFSARQGNFQQRQVKVVNAAVTAALEMVRAQGTPLHHVSRATPGSMLPRDKHAKIVRLEA